jgi:predicted acylesterase/phospholipase RssA
MEIGDFGEPTTPRPPAAEIDRVYHDLATVLSDAGQDADGRRAFGREALGARLKSAGHSAAAIEWAVHLFCRIGLLRMSILKEKQVRTIGRGASEAKARTIAVPAVAAADEFWKRWQAGTFTSSRAYDPPPSARSEDPVSAGLADTPPQVMENPTPLALVMKGGGIKGLAYVGALEILARKYEFNWFVGTSAGAITAILLGAGYTDGELTEILKGKDFRDFFDAKWHQMPFNLWFHKGFYHADSFTKWMDTLLAKKLRSPVRVSLSKLPKNKRVIVYASQRAKNVLTFDSFRSEDDAAYAARCSISIPLVFVPQFHQGLRTYDGGIKYNYPVDKLLEEYPKTKFIGLYLGAEIYEGIERTSVLADIVSIVMESSEPDHIEKYRDSTVIIDTRPINTLDFSLTDEEKEFLLQAGRTAALAHLDDKSDEYAAAVKKRDDLKKSVEEARNAAASKRRRKRCWLLVLHLLLIGGATTWWLWPNGARAKDNHGDSGRAGVPKSTPDPRSPSGPATYPKIDAAHPQRPLDSGFCTLTIFNETSEPIRLWRFIPILKDGTPPAPLGKTSMPGQWRDVLLEDRERPTLEANGGWSYITIERISETTDALGRERIEPNRDSAHQESDLQTYDKGWTYFRYDSHLIIHINKSFFNDSPEDKRLGFTITNRESLDESGGP